MHIPVWQRPYAIGPAETAGTTDRTRERATTALRKNIVCGGDEGMMMGQSEGGGGIWKNWGNGKEKRPKLYIM